MRYTHTHTHTHTHRQQEQLERLRLDRSEGDEVQIQPKATLNSKGKKTSRQFKIVSHDHHHGQ